MEAATGLGEPRASVTETSGRALAARTCRREVVMDKGFAGSRSNPVPGLGELLDDSGCFSLG